MLRNPSLVVRTSCANILRNSHLFQRFKYSQSQTTPNGEAQCPPALPPQDKAEAAVIVISDESSKSEKVEENGEAKAEPAPAVVPAEPEMFKDPCPEAEPKGQKCWNKLCCSNEATRKIKSKVDDRILVFCRSCAASYNCLKFCEVCQQIQPSDDAGDGLQWVLCESEACSRWNHVICQTKRGRFDGSSKYFCSQCERKNRRKRPTVMESLELGRPSKQKKQVDAAESKRIRIFDVRKDNYHYLQPFLSTYSYRLALAEDAIASDLQFLRQRHSNSGELVKRNIDTGNKKKKR